MGGIKEKTIAAKRADGNSEVNKRDTCALGVLYHVLALQSHAFTCREKAWTTSYTGVVQLSLFLYALHSLLHCIYVDKFFGVSKKGIVLYCYRSILTEHSTKIMIWN